MDAVSADGTAAVTDVTTIVDTGAAISLLLCDFLLKFRIGTTLIIGPTDDVAAFYAAVPGSQFSHKPLQ